jgi:mgtE-like transporter
MSASLPSSIAALLRRESRSLRQGFTANLVSSFGDLVAGAVLGSVTGRLEALPGLLILIPPAIGMRGNIFAAMGSRLGTALHLGEFTVSFRRGAVLGDNISAATINTLLLSALMAPMARIVSVAFGISAISTLDFLAISIIGGVLSSAVVLVATVAISIVSARRGWDLDYVSPPLVTVTGDVVTLPSLVAASYVAQIKYITPIVAIGTLMLAASVVFWQLWQSSERVRRIVKESVPVLMIAAIVDIVAGVTLEKRLSTFLVFPAFLVMLPAFLENSGALGSMLAARLASKLHAGIFRPLPHPLEALPELILILVLSFPVYLALGISAGFLSRLMGVASPGIFAMVGVTVFAGILAIIAAMIVAYYAAVASFRLGLDPDNHGAPLVTSSMDVAASVALVVVLALTGYAAL